MLENQKLTRKLLIILLLVFGPVVLVRAQDVKKIGTSAAAFLRIPVGSRGTAMGSAFVSMADDGSAMYWNPGGMARVSGYSFYADHSSWLPGLDFNYVGVILPVPGAGKVGFSVTALTTADMIVTTPENPQGTGETFSATSIAAGISFARNLTERFSIGGTAKYVSEKIFNSTAYGFAFDIGTLYTTPFNGIRLGVSISNFGTKMRITGEDLNVRVDIAPDQKGNNQSIVGRLSTDKFNMPLIMRVGLSWDAINSPMNRFTLAVDGINPNDNSQSVNVGGEYAFYHETILIWGGFNDLFLEDREKGFTAGIGINIKRQGKLGFKAQFAHQDFRYLSGVERFSLALTF